MACYLQLENISKSYGPKVLFEHIGFNVNEGDKIALIAPNGTGKTSLLRILAGKDSSDSGGKVMFLKDIRIAFLEQDYEWSAELSIIDQVLSHCSRDILLFHEEEKTAFIQRLKELLTSFRLPDFSQKMGELSGGEVKRVAISEMLALNADFLIMDEPTNHLDIEAVEFLESWLKRSRCTLLMVTHDRYFLDRVCNIVMELDHGAVYSYRGNYQNYLEKREERISSWNAETDKVRNLLRRELEWIHATPCARSGKAKYRINAFHELSERASMQRNDRQISLEGVGEVSRLGNKIINCKNLCYSWEGQCMLNNFSYNFQRGDKVGIVGRNGIGKSTFLELLTGGLAADSGEISRGSSLVIGYYRQQGMEFDGEMTVLDAVPDTRLLSNFMFPRDMYTTRISRLSGGERRRLYLLTILMQNPNLLILDEPTNDLDIVTLNILEEFLADYGGSLIVVSHDRHFLDRTVDHLLVFCGDGAVKDFVGKFSEYRAWIKDVEASRKKEDTDKQQKTAQKPAAERNAAAQGPRKLSYKEKKELEQIEAAIPELEEEKHALEAEMSSGTLPYDALQKKAARIEEIISELDRMETRWLELSA